MAAQGPLPARRYAPAVTILDLHLTGIAVGGEAVGRGDDGRVVFVRGGAPGDHARVALTEERKRFARGEVVEVLEPSPVRVTPPCVHLAEGCGGCDWQHIDPPAQRTLRLDQVTETLSRFGGVVDGDAALGPAVPATGVRTTVRGVATSDGRFGFHRHHSSDLVPVDTCLVTHPLVSSLLAEGRFPPGAALTIRVGARTGDRLVVVDGNPDEVHVPDDVTVVSTAALKAGHRAWIHEECAGRRWRISAESFFQASPEGAEALVNEVGALVATHAPDAQRLVDLCAGVGLFAGTVGAEHHTVAVERSPGAVADARVNLADTGARILKVALGSWRPSRADVVVADPARAGLGREGVAAVAGTKARLCILVSCEVGSFGRDTALLTAAGYRHAGSRTLDLFGHTGRVEVVTAFVRD